MINSPTETKMRPALVAVIDDENVALLFSFSSAPSKGSIKLGHHWLNPNRFMLTHISALIIKEHNKRQLVSQQTLDLCLSRSKWNTNNFTSIEDNYKSIGC